MEGFWRKLWIVIILSLSLFIGVSATDQGQALGQRTGDAAFPRSTAVRYDFASSGPPAISDIRESNRTPSAITISWLTSTDSPGEVHYSPGSSLASSYETATDNRTGQIHWVELSGLQVNQTYHYEVQSGTMIDNNSGRYYQFTTTPIAEVCSNYFIGGRVVKPDQSPLPEALVLVTVNQYGIVSDSLSVVTNRYGYWFINLADLKSSSTGNQLCAARDDEVSIEIVGPEGWWGEDVRLVDDLTEKKYYVLCATNEERTVATPEISASSVTSPGFMTVGITCTTSRAEIHYTVDGSEPDERSPVYTVPLSLGSGTAIKAKGYRAGWQTSDIASFTVTVDLQGPRIVACSATGKVKPPIQHIDVTFDEAVDSVSFQGEDVSIIGPGGTIFPDSIAILDSNSSRITFPEQKLAGDYQVIIGPGICDLAGNVMDQDKDLVNGEKKDDRYTAQFSLLPGLRIIAVTPTGDQTSPVNSITLTFNQEINPATLTNDGLFVITPDGRKNFFGHPNPAGSTDQATTYSLSYYTSMAGTYHIYVGPRIESVDGLAMDQDGDGLIGEDNEDRYHATFTIIDTTGPRITYIRPSGMIINPPVRSFDIAFNEAVDPFSFKAEDVSIQGPSGKIIPDSVAMSPSNERAFLVTIPPQQADGVYQIAIGPQVLDLAGNPMDQNRDGLKGETSFDQYSSTFTIDATGPKIIATSVTGIQNGAVRTIDITFNEPIKSFPSYSTVTITGPPGAIKVYSIYSVNYPCDTFRITLSPYQMDGTYQVEIKPLMVDYGGNALDQDGDGTKGEASDDVYRFTFVQQLPDLAVTEISHPDKARSQVEITWKVINEGLGQASGQWTDTVYLSNDQALGSDDSVLAEGQIEKPLDAGQSYTRTLTVTLPATDGLRWIIVKTNSQGTLDEQKGVGVNNTLVAAAPIWITGQSFPDLQVKEIAVPGVLHPGEYGILSWTIENTGDASIGANSSWYDTLYLSLDTNIDSGDIELARIQKAYSSLAPGTSYTQSRQINIPSLTPEDSYYLLVKTDAYNTVEEFLQENNNIGQSSGKVKVEKPLPPYLHVDYVHAPEAVRQGQTIPVEWKITNTGEQEAQGIYGHDIAFSLDDVYTAADTRLIRTSQSYPVILPGSSQTGSASVTIPNYPPGTYYLFFIPDSLGKSNVVGRNYGMTEITLPFPDLSISSLSSPDSAFSGQEIALRWYGENKGDGSTTTAAWMDAIYLSEDTIVDETDLKLGSLTRKGSLDSGQGYDASYFVKLPSAIEGNYYILVKTDDNDQVKESNEEDNITSSTLIAISLPPAPDLRVESFTAPSEGFCGKAIWVDWKVGNAGTAPAPGAWTDAVYLSQDGTFDSPDTLLGTFDHLESLPAGETYGPGAPQQIMLPDRIEGTHYLFFVTNNGESEKNNISVPQKITLACPAPDLRVDYFTFPSEGFIIADQTIVQVDWKVSNAGTAPALGTWTDAIYLSKDSVFDSSDILLSTFTHPGPLEKGAGYGPDTSQRIRFPDRTEGDYYLFFVSDSGENVYEKESETNNISSPYPVTLISFAPDLMADTFTAPSEGIAGQPVQVDWQVINAGTDYAVGIWTDAVYLSRNNVFDSSDMLLSAFAHSESLKKGAAYGPETPQDIMLPDLIEGGYYLFFVTDKDKNIYEKESETNNISSPHPITVTYPVPDLMVDTFTAPSEGIASIQADWQVINAGTAPASGTWTDAIYLSEDSTFDSSDVLLSAFTHSQYLEKGAAYGPGTPQEIILPDRIEGSYYLFFVTDDHENVYEKGSETNNISSPHPITVTCPAPDLIVDNFTTLSEGIAGQPIQVDWKVSNAGAAPALGSWTDAIYLSEDNTFDSSDVLLSAFTHSEYLEKGASYGPETPQDIMLPDHIEGTYYLFYTTGGKIPQNDAVLTVWAKGDFYEYYGYVTVYADGIELGVIYNTATQCCGRFNKAQITIPRDDFLPLIQDGEITFVLQTSAYVNCCCDFQAYLSLHYELNDSSGSYMFDEKTETRSSGHYGGSITFTLKDKNIYGKESEKNNVSQAQPISPTKTADLQVQTASAPDMAVAGSVIGVDWTILNGGDAAAKRWQDRIYLSDDADFDSGSDRLCGAFDQTETLEPGKSTGPPMRPAFIRIPDRLAGTCYLFVVTDAQDFVYEKKAGEANNVFVVPRPVKIIVHPSDLQVTTVNAPLTARAGTSIDISWTVQNKGVRETDETSWKDGVYLSADETFNPASDIALGLLSHSEALPAGAAYSQSASFSLRRELAGTYYVYVAADALHQVYEYDKEGNNTTSSPGTMQIVPVQADLEVSSLTVPLVGYQDKPMEISWSVTNTGPETTQGSSWNDTVYLSANKEMTASYSHLVTLGHQGALAGGESYSVTRTVKVPSWWQVGDCYLVIKTDSGSLNNIYEYDGEENNTTFAPLTIDLPPTPDLKVTDIKVADTAWSGQNMRVAWTVTNEGPVPATEGSWNDTVYLSKDPYLDPGTDPPLGNAVHQGVLDANVSYTQSLEPKLPDLIQGTYYLIVATDSSDPDHVFERDKEDNNTLVSLSTVQINLTPPADLTIHSVTPPVSGIYGEPATWSYEVKNAGELPAAGTWYDTLYLSSDQEWTLGDERIARIRHEGDIGPGQRYTGTFPADLPAVIPGNYYVIACTDIFDDVQETDNENNTAVSIGQLTVEGRELIPDRPESGTIGKGQSIYYQITPEAGQQDIVVTLSGAARESVEVFAACGKVPKRSDYDTKAETAASGDLRVRLSGTCSSVYYILVYGYRCPDHPAPSFELNAVLPGHSISGISVSEGGNTGPVTIAVTGYNFAPETTAFLRDASGTTIDRGIVYFRDSGFLSATFDLEGKAAGSYRLELENPDGSLCSTGFQVVQGKGGNLFSRLVVPNVVRNRRTCTLVLEYGNTGDADLPAPLFTISGNSLIQLRLSSSLSSQQYNPLTIPGTARENPKDVLPPGSFYSIEVEFVINGSWGGSISYVSSYFLYLRTSGYSQVQAYPVSSIGSYDPNLKMSGAGFGPLNHILNTEELEYTIYFENQKEALASAQRVTVTDHLSSNLDWSTFELGAMEFGPHQVEVPAGLNSYSTRIDLRPQGNNLLVDIEADFDPATGLASWTFSAIDPATGEFTEDPLAGFLPPNGDNHEGEGYVKFKIKPKAGLPTGAVIENVATIIFDWNPPIDTPLIFNTIDAGAPESQVLPLPEQSKESFIVTWTGRDDAGGSGVAAYDIYFSENGAEPKLWLSQTQAQGGMFAGQGGKTYAFFSQAADNVGNREQAPAQPDARTRTLVNAPPLAPSVNLPGRMSSVTTLTPILSVNNGHDPDGDPLSYEFEIYLNPDLTPPAIASVKGLPEGAPITSWQLETALIENTWYSWRARAFDGVSYSEWMQAATFVVNLEDKELTASDRNFKLVGAGFGPMNHVSGTEDLEYGIFFENDKEAPASAQRVTVTDHLSPDLDWSTFELGAMEFGPHRVEVPAGLNSYSIRIDLRPQGNNLFVDIEADFDPATGLASWTFSAIDPDTGEFTEDPTAGFLPPNGDNHVGEGYVKFKIMPKAGLPTGAVIDNIATITFNWNPPIDTPRILNTIDAGAPESQVLPLPEESSQHFAVTWTGQDDAGGSGVAAYDIYFSENGAEPKLWLSQTQAQSGIFTGQGGKTYAFFSRAADYVGNREQAPAQPDARTKILVNAPPPAPSVNLPGRMSTVPTLTPVLSVNNSHDPDGNSLSYEFEIYPNPDLTPPVIASVKGLLPEGAPITSWQLETALMENIWYSWRARAFDGVSYSEWMQAATFVVKQAGICNGLDNDGDGRVDEGVQNTYYADGDGDGYGNALRSIQACSAPFGYVEDNTDCNDTDQNIHPGAPEIPCNERDDDCEGGDLCEEICNGDLNGDGKITPVDALIAFKCSLGSGPCPDCSDANQDDRVTSEDALYILNQYLILSMPWPDE
ncbi:MAG: CARDB domain-containing protein [bacterium]